MAILAPFRAPQPQAYSLNPSTVSKDGAFHGWALPINLAPAGVGAVYYSKHFALNAFASPVRGVGVTTFVLPARWGLQFGVLAYNVPAPP